MRDRSSCARFALLALLGLVLSSASCNLLESEGFHCAADENCPAGLTCCGGVCAEQCGPCATACDSPPEATCSDTDTLQVFFGGACASGACAYESTEVSCSGCPVCDSCYAVTEAGVQAVAAGALNPANACEICATSPPASGFVPLSCVQQTPIDVCRQLAGRCERREGCSGTSCCVFDPAWDGSGSAPACPLAGEDANADGVQDLGETWGGECDAQGGCTGCATGGQCDDGNPCTANSCTAGACTSIDLTGEACTVAGLIDGICAAGALGVECRRSDGQACSSDSECASNHCVCAIDGCTARVCSLEACDTCRYLHAGACVAVSAGSQGEGCTEPDRACNQFQECRLADGVSCSGDDQECAGKNCECSASDCSAMLCSAVDCDCQLNADGHGTCDGPLDPGVSDPEPSCPADSGCNGNGACRAGLGAACSAGDDCASGHCVDGVCCESPCDAPCDTCDGDGQCVLSPAGAPGNPSCGPPLFCTGTDAACPVACTTEGDCAAPEICIGGLCVLP